jgi:putative endonuclease
MRPPPSPARRRAQRRGVFGESVAAALLRLKGYRILARNLRLPAGEIDIIAKRGRTLAFVEVKTRPDDDGAARALLPRQRRRLARAAAQWLGQRPAFAGHGLRFDVVLVRSGFWPRHIADAWRPGET